MSKELFPRTTVGGVSVSRLVVGTNWFYGWSHTSAAKDRHIKSFQTKQNVVEILTTFLSAGVDTVLGPALPQLTEATKEAEDRTGRRCILIYTPSFNILPGGRKEDSPPRALDRCAALGATFCLPHESITDRLIDRMHRKIRGWDKYAALIRHRGMIPGLSTHLPQAVRIADDSEADVETYIQIYNAAGFLMPIEADWVMRLIRDAAKPVLTIKPLAAGRLLPPVGLAFAWNTIRDRDMVAVGTMTADEAKEIIDLSLDFLARRSPSIQLQETRSKQSLK